MLWCSRKTYTAHSMMATVDESSDGSDPPPLVSSSSDGEPPTRATPVDMVSEDPSESSSETEEDDRLRFKGYHTENLKLNLSSSVISPFTFNIDRPYHFSCFSIVCCDPFVLPSWPVGRSYFSCLFRLLTHVWEMLMLPSDAHAATNLTSLRLPDGNTSDHSNNLFSLKNN